MRVGQLPAAHCRACKYALNTLMNIFNSSALPSGLSQQTLSGLVRVLLMRLVDDHLGRQAEGEALLKVSMEDARCCGCCFDFRSMLLKSSMGVVSVLVHVLLMRLGDDHLGWQAEGEALLKVRMEGVCRCRCCVVLHSRKSVSTMACDAWRCCLCMLPMFISSHLGPQLGIDRAYRQRERRCPYCVLFSLFMLYELRCLNVVVSRRWVL
jgi:hypothetical protein